MKQSLYRWKGAEGPSIHSQRAQSYHHSTVVRGYELDSLESEITLPVTALCEFLFCKRCFYLTYKMGLPKPKTKNAVRGRMLHELHMGLLSREFKLASKFFFDEEPEDTASRYTIEAEGILQHTSRGFEEDFDRLDIKWEDESSKIRRHIEYISLKWANWLRELAIIHAVDGVELAKKCIPYRHFEEYYKAPELALCGKVDVIEHGKPVEVKTGKAPDLGIFSSHALQVVWYAFLMEYVDGRDVDCAEVYYAKRFERRKLSLTQELRQWALFVRDSALELLIEGNLQEICECCH